MSCPLGGARLQRQQDLCHPPHRPERRRATLQAKGFSLADAEATLAVFSPSEEGVGETEAVYSTPRSSASR